MIPTLQCSMTAPALWKVPPGPMSVDAAYSAARTELWLPRKALTACVRGIMARDTRGLWLPDHQRYNFMPATPTCALLWYLEGGCELLEGWDPSLTHSPRRTMPRAAVCGPFSHPTISWNPGSAHAFMVLLMPDALARMTGLDVAELANRVVAAGEILDASWLAFYDEVACATDDDARVALVSEFLMARWQRVRPASAWHSHHISDWSRSVALRAATSGVGRSLRQAERRIKQWTGQTQRNLHVLGRSERAFFRSAEAVRAGEVDWSAIADHSGYADQSHFCRETRRVTGFAPEEFRRRMEADEGFWAYRLWAFGAGIEVV